MCGIIGYVGSKNATDVLMHGLKTLEYRGYDSAGIAVINNNELQIIKSKGKISFLEEKIKGVNFENTHIGIGHTRWATHGGVTEVNSHPHNVGSVILVHNGIAENYVELKLFLTDKGYKFKSETDTEVVCALIDYLYKLNNNKLNTLSEAQKLLHGSYALGIIFDDDKDNIYCMRKDSPLIIAKGEKENFIASDAPAILKYTKDYIILENNDIAIINKENIDIFNSNLEKINRKIITADYDNEEVSKNGYGHFMLKEINDIPGVIRNLTNTYLNNDVSTLVDKIPDFSNYDMIHIVACGSAMHAGLVGKSLIEKYGNIPVTVDIASEYRYKKNFYDKKTLLIVVSQSGETADTVESLRKAKKDNVDSLAIVNVFGSSIAREADSVMYLNAGSEIAVATTKAYSAQITLLALIALKMGNKYLNNEELKIILNDIKRLPSLINDVNNIDYEFLANRIYNKENIFFMGRGIDYALSMEGSLKLKEISYIHSEAYPSGELKHGTISLIERDTPIIGIITDEQLKDKSISNLKEVKARGADIILVTTNNLDSEFDFCNNKIIVPQIHPILQPILTITPLQLLSYHIAKLRGCEIDQPKNLAKSVTVE